MRLIPNIDTGLLVALTTPEQGLFLKQVHPTKLTTRQVYERVVKGWTANLEQSIIEAIHELEAEQ